MENTAFLTDVTLRYPANAMGTGNAESTVVYRVLAVGPTLSAAVDRFLADMTMPDGSPELVEVALVATADENDYFIVDSPLGGETL